MDNIETIYKLHVDDLYSYGIHLGFDGSLVMDAIHNVFQKILLNKNLNYTTNTKAYLLKSLRNELFDEYKRSSVGAVFEWKSPFGPLQLIFAQPIDDEPSDDTSTFEFALGSSF